MQKSESVFWGAVIVAGLYLASGWNPASLRQSNTQVARTGGTAVQAQTAPPTAPSGGHYMPDGTWMADGAMGGGCGMHGGGGCGCGH